jgi:hypothetical protein
MQFYAFNVGEHLLKDFHIQTFLANIESFKNIDKHGFLSVFNF